MGIYNSTKYLSDFEAKKMIIEIGKRMYQRGYVASNDGNISVKVGPNMIWTTPTGVSKGFMTQDMLVKINSDGKVLLGKYKPSSEVKMHLRVYEENPDVLAVSHAHPPVATSFAIAGISLDQAILPEAVVNLGSVPIANYATPGSHALPDSIAPYCKTHNAVLLANHGALSWGKDLIEAYHRLESLEYYATVLMYTGRIIGKANELSCNQVDELIAIREKLGIQGGGRPPCTIEAPKIESRKVERPIQLSSIGYKHEGCGCSVSIPNQVVAKEEKKKIEQQDIDVLVHHITAQVLQRLKGG